MARAGVTYAEVEEAAHYLLGIGKNPTVDAIREYLGTGSRTTLAEHLKRWKSMQTDGQGRLPQPLLALVTGLWDGLQSSADQRIQEHQTHAQQEIDTLKTKLQHAQHTENQLNQTSHQLQEKLDAEQRTTSSLTTQLQAVDNSYDKLNAAHQTSLLQLENAKQENQRLHQLALQIQANLEHYQEAVQQQQLEQNLAKERQQAVFAQEIAQQKIAAEDAATRFHASEKCLAATQLKLEQLTKSHDELTHRYDNAIAKQQTVEQEFLQLKTEADFRFKQSERYEHDLVVERDVRSKLQQQVTILTEQLQLAQNELDKAEDKIELLRQEKLFLTQEKAHIEGAMRLLQKKQRNGVIVKGSVGSWWARR